MTQRPFDPLQAMREFLDRAERRVNEILADRLAGEDASAARGRISEMMLSAHKRALDGWARYFESMNLPTRPDVIRLGKRIAEVEESLARIEAQLRRVEKHLAAPERVASPSPGGAARPRRTRRPPERERVAEEKA